MTATVLIADRNAAHRVILRSMAAEVFAQTRMAGCVDDLMVEVSLHVPRLIVIAADLAGPVPLGDLMARLRLMAPGTPVMVVVSDTLPAHIAAFDAGADDVMAQPLNQALFHARVRRLLRHHAPTMSRVTGLAEATTQFHAALPVALWGVPLPDRARVARVLLQVGLSAQPPDVVPLVRIYWGVDQPMDNAALPPPMEPVIYVTPNATPEAEAHLLSLRGTDVQSGPPDPAILRARIDRLRSIPPLAHSDQDQPMPQTPAGTRAIAWPSDDLPSKAPRALGKGCYLRPPLGGRDSSVSSRSA